MVTTLWVVGLMMSLALVAAASLIGNAITSIGDAVESAATAIENEAPEDHAQRSSRTIAPEPGTRLACVVKGTDGREIAYAPVLAFVESRGTAWQALAIVKGTLYLDDGYIDRVLLPGQFLSEEESADMKQRYAEAYPAEIAQPA